MRKHSISNKIILLSLLLSVSIFTQVKLPKLVSDGMVLQRDTKVKLWGWSSAKEKIKISFAENKFETVADENGNWQIFLPEMKAGGPYVMQIDANNSITINDILVGDVWVCSGQSNMGFALGNLRNVYPEEIEKSKNQFIRQFFVRPGNNFIGSEDNYQSGNWVSVSPETARWFTAVGYFFAKNLYDKYKIPIGLINASLGGSSAEAWISEESIKSFPIYYENLQKFKKPGYLEKLNKQDNERIENWIKLIKQNDAGLNNSQTWFDPELNTSDWETIKLPGYWANTKLGNVNGVVWFRKKINIPPNMVNKPAVLKLGRIFDCDTVFINGKYVGSMGSQYASRNYKIPENILKEGENTIVVRVISYIRKGGFVPGRNIL